MSLHRPRPSWSGDNDGGAYSIEGDLLCGRGTPCLLLVFSLLGSTRSDLWILNFSRVLLLHVLVCVSRVLQCFWQNHGPSYLSVALHIDTFRRVLYQYSL